MDPFSGVIRQLFPGRREMGRLQWENLSDQDRRRIVESEKVRREQLLNPDIFDPITGLPRIPWQQGIVQRRKPTSIGRRPPSSNENDPLSRHGGLSLNFPTAGPLFVDAPPNTVSYIDPYGSGLSDNEIAAREYAESLISPEEFSYRSGETDIIPSLQSTYYEGQTLEPELEGQSLAELDQLDALVDPQMSLADENQGQFAAGQSLVDGGYSAAVAPEDLPGEYSPSFWDKITDYASNNLSSDPQDWLQALAKGLHGVVAGHSGEYPGQAAASMEALKQLNAEEFARNRLAAQLEADDLAAEQWAKTYELKVMAAKEAEKQFNLNLQLKFAELLKDSGLTPELQGDLAGATTGVQYAKALEEARASNAPPGFLDAAIAQKRENISSELLRTTNLLPLAKWFQDFGDSEDLVDGSLEVDSFRSAIASFRMDEKNIEKFITDKKFRDTLRQVVNVSRQSIEDYSSNFSSGASTSTQTLLNLRDKVVKSVGDPQNLASINDLLEVILSN